MLDFIRNEYIPNGWHELDVVPVFIATRKLKNYAEDMGIQKPNLYGAGKEIAKRLRNLTPNNYVIKKVRAKTSDIQILDPYEFEKEKLTNPQRSIVKE